MIEIKNKKDCCGCHACYSICPKKAIQMKEDENGFLVPKISKNKCINCELCKKVCPIINLSKTTNNPVAYAMINNDIGVRKESSSGGIFSLIAECILELDGIVFGATFNEQFEVIHSYITQKSELNKLRGSKYVQSSIGDCFIMAKQFLDNNRYVLFSGTPCQIEGLKKYLGKEYNKLYTQDIICHGVPSPKIWRKYLQYREQKDGGEKAVKISFRDKRRSWNNYEISFRYNNHVYTQDRNTDLFMRLFLQNISLRESCYECKFKKIDRISDITLADFWGIKKILPKFNDNNGTSLVIINSDRGKELFNKIKNKTRYTEVELQEALKYNKSMSESSKRPKQREEFFREINERNIEKVAQKYIPKISFYDKIKIKVKKLLRK